MRLRLYSEVREQSGSGSLQNTLQWTRMQTVEGWKRSWPSGGTRAVCKEAMCFRSASGVPRLTPCPAVPFAALRFCGTTRYS